MLKMADWTKKFENLITDDKILSKFRLNKFFPLIESKPDAVFVPEKKRDILKIIKFAQKNKIPLIPYSSEWDFHGSTTALKGGIIVDLRRLSRIEKVRECFDGMSADLEPGVTFRKLNEELMYYNLRSLLPLRLPADCSVLSTYYGRNPLLEANKYGYHQDWMILTYQMAISKGIFVGMGSEGLETGGEPGDYPYSPRADLGRMFLGSIGAFGIVSRATVKLKYRPEKYEFLFTSGNNLIEILMKLRKITISTDAGQTVLIADPKILASYLAKSRQEYSDFRDKLADWTGIIAIAGNDEYIEVEKADLLEAANRVGLQLLGEESYPHITKLLRAEFRVPENVGRCFDFAPHLRIEFYTTAGKLEKIRAIMNEFFKSIKLPEDNIGFIANSLEMGRTYFCEYDIYYDPPAEKIDPAALPTIGEKNLHDLYEECYKTLINANAVINVPRNIITAQLLYPRVSNYYEMMRVLKYCLDPNNIMHPSIIFGGQGGIDPKTIQIAKEVTQ